MVPEGGTIGKGLLSVMSSGALGATDSAPTSVDFGVDKWKLHVPSNATGSNSVRVWASKTNNVAVRYPRT